MAKTRPYRGRQGKWKTLAIITLAVFTVLLFLAYTYKTNDDFRSAVSDIAAVLRGERLPEKKPDDTDTPPSGEPTPETEPVPETETEPEKPKTGPILRLSDTTVDEAAKAGAYGVIVDLKLTGGEVTYLSEVAGASAAVQPDAYDLKALAQSCHEKGLVLWGRLSAFTDHLGPRNVQNSGVTVASGVLFLDGNYRRSLDPYKAPARQYVEALAREAVAAGVDMVLLADVCYPTYGKLSLISYKDGGLTKQQQLGEFIYALSDLPITVEIPMRALYDATWAGAAGYGFDAPATAVVIDPSALPVTIGGVLCETAQQAAAAVAPAVPIGAGPMVGTYIE
jgi:hypothetical protein